MSNEIILDNYRGTSFISRELYRLARRFLRGFNKKILAKMGSLYDSKNTLKNEVAKVF
jgi:hypothetical protein